MSLVKFTENDIFRNTLTAYPKFQFKINNGKVISLNNNTTGFLSYASMNLDDLMLDEGQLDFSEENQSVNIVFI